MTLANGRPARGATVPPYRDPPARRRAGRRPPRPDDARREARPARLALVVRGPRRPGPRPAKAASAAGARHRPGHPRGRRHEPPPQRASRALANEIQRFLVEETRLGIPAIVHEECLHGVMARDATCFPQSIGLAATLGPGARRADGAAHRPATCGRRVPTRRWRRSSTSRATRAGAGSRRPTARTRTWSAALGCAYVRGIQGERRTADGRCSPPASTWSATGVPEGGLNHAPAHIGERELRDAFLFPFEAAVREAGIRSMMHAYDDVDGVPCVASRELLTDDPARASGASTASSSPTTWASSYVLEPPRDGRRPAGAAAWRWRPGSTSSCPPRSPSASRCARRSQAGRVDGRCVDHAVARVLRRSSRLGLFERPYVRRGGAGSCARTARRPALAREAARRSIVLLQNDGMLPLRPRPRHDRGHRPERRQRPQPARRLRPRRAHRDAARDARPAGRRRVERPARPPAGRRARGLADGPRRDPRAGRRGDRGPLTRRAAASSTATTPTSRRPSRRRAAPTWPSSWWASAPG